MLQKCPYTPYMQNDQQIPEKVIIIITISVVSLHTIPYYINLIYSVNLFINNILRNQPFIPFR